MYAHSVRALVYSALFALFMLSGCASLTGREPMRMNVVGLEPVTGQGLEMRFIVRLRLQNPNDTSLDYDGVAFDLDLNDRPFASGVSDQKGNIPRFGETVISVLVSVSAFSAVRQAWRLPGAATAGRLPYALRGRLGGGLFGGTRVTSQGILKLPPLPN